MKKLFDVLAIALFIVVCFVCGAAYAGTQVDQGQPGNFGDWPIATAAHYAGTFARVQVSHTVPTLMTAGITGTRKSISIQNFDTTQGLYCGFNNLITLSSAGFYIPPKSSNVPGSWSADLGLSITVYCLAETSTQVNPADSGVVEAK